MERWVIGVDVGGTFTDFAALQVETGTIQVYKRPSTPDDPARAILEGLGELAKKTGIDMGAIDRFAHGTTVGTNALLQRRGATVGVVTTKGFRDLLEIGRQIRPKIYSLQEDAPEPLAAREHRLEVAERVGPAGEVITALTDAALARLVDEVRSMEGVQSLAVCLLFSFLNPEHEARIAKVIAAVRPDLAISTSSAVQPEFREYERFSTTLINAFLQPEVGRYMDRLRTEIAAMAPNAMVGIFQSSGGLMTVDQATRFPVRTALSGPAAGAVGAAAAAARSGIGDVITLDMGGTSTDVCLIRDGQADIANVRDIAGFRIRLPMLDINTVGAGGGSIAHIGPDGLMRVGPESAGAVPGPACYGKGGTLPTVSDANVVLGRLPMSLAGGGLTLDRGRAEAAVATVAEALGVSTIKAALGIIGIVNSNMTRAIRAVSTEKGHDPRAFALMPFGGAGGLHAVELAASLGMRTILVPAAPGILCAEGLIRAELQENYVATCRTALDQPLDAVAAALAGLAVEARAWLDAQAHDTINGRLVVTLDMRFVGQNYELPVTVGETAAMPELPDVAVLREGFFAEHLRGYGHVDREAPVEIVNIRLKALASLGQQPAEAAAPSGAMDPLATQDVWFAEDAPVATPIHDRPALPIGTIIRGPAILTQLDATTVVPPGTAARVDDALNLVLEIEDA